MKKLYTTILSALLAITASAQNVYLCKGGDYTVQTITEGLDIDLSQGYDSILFTKPQIAPVVTVAYSGTGASVTIPSFVSGVTAKTNGANVTITSTNTADEITYVATGSSTSGSLTINGEYKLSLVLDDLNLISTTGSAINVQCGKRIAVILKEGTTSTLADAAGGEQKACLYTKGHFEFEGAGTLNVSGNAGHAIASKEYTQLKKSTGTINIQGAAKDAMHIGQYFQMNGGTVKIDNNTIGDGIQVELTKDATDENNGQMMIKGGTITVTMASQDTKALRADKDIAISGGTININANGNGSRGIQTDTNMTISDANNATNITISAAGDKCTLPECAEDPHKCMGIKVDGNLTISGGTTTVYNTGKKAKGIKVGGTYTKTGGTVNAVFDN